MIRIIMMLCFVLKIIFFPIGTMTAEIESLKKDFASADSDVVMTVQEWTMHAVTDHAITIGWSYFYIVTIFS